MPRTVSSQHPHPATASQVEQTGAIPSRMTYARIHRPTDGAWLGCMVALPTGVFARRTYVGFDAKTPRLQTDPDDTTHPPSSQGRSMPSEHAARAWIASNPAIPDGTQVCPDLDHMEGISGIRLWAEDGWAFWAVARLAAILPAPCAYPTDTDLVCLLLSDRKVMGYVAQTLHGYTSTSMDPYARAGHGGNTRVQHHPDPVELGVKLLRKGQWYRTLDVDPQHNSASAHSRMASLRAFAQAEQGLSAALDRRIAAMPLLLPGRGADPIHP